VPDSALFTGMDRGLKAAIVGIVAILLFAGCQQQELSIETLNTLPEGQECNTRAIAELIARENPGVDTARARQEADHLFSEIGCGQTSPTPLVSAAAPPREEIPIQRQGSNYTVPVRINQTITLPFILDTGAEELVIPPDLAMTLVRAGALSREDVIGKGHYIMANGSEETQPRVVIREVQVGDHTVTDVPASVSSSTNSSPLLGESFLSKFGTVTIDYNRLVLILSQ
jgi:clan AA aspartic protease (TIGR02281 family)